MKPDWPNHSQLGIRKWQLRRGIMAVNQLWGELSDPLLLYNLCHTTLSRLRLTKHFDGMSRRRLTKPAFTHI